MNEDIEHDENLHGFPLVEDGMGMVEMAFMTFNVESEQPGLMPSCNADRLKIETNPESKTRIT